MIHFICNDLKKDMIMNIQKLTSTPAQVNTIANVGYRVAMVTGIAIGYAKIGHMLMKSAPAPKLEAKLDSGTVSSILYIGLGLYTRDMLVARGIIPGDVLK